MRDYVMGLCVFFAQKRSDRSWQRLGDIRAYDVKREPEEIRAKNFVFASMRRQSQVRPCYPFCP